MRNPPAIDAYGGGGFRVAGLWRPGSLLILEDEPRDWPAVAIDDLTPDDFADVFAARRGAVELVLLGTGVAPALPPKAVREALRAAGLGLEFLATEPAVRLHNVLVSEGRLIATALIAI